METHSGDQEEDVSFSSEGVDLANRLRGIPQDRLIEEIIALWDEVNNLDPETIYFITNLLNKLELKEFRNEILSSALPLRI